MAHVWGGLIVWSTADGTVRRQSPGAQMVAWNPRRPQLLVDACAGQAQFLSSDDFTHQGYLTGHEEVRVTDAPVLGVDGVSFAPDGDHALTSGMDGTVRYWNLDTRVQQWIYTESSSVLDFTFLPGGEFVLLTLPEAPSQVVSLADGSVVHQDTDLPPGLTPSLSPDGSRLMVAEPAAHLVHVVDASSLRTLEQTKTDVRVRDATWISETRAVMKTAERNGAHRGVAVWTSGNITSHPLSFNDRDYSIDLRAGAQPDTFYLSHLTQGVIEYDANLTRVRVFEKP